MTTNNENTATDDVISKIRKCLALANGLNATQGEMEAAMARAKAIALKHSIDIGSINMEAGKSAAAGMEIQKGNVGLRSKNEQKYHRWIYHALTTVFGIRIIRSGRTIYFIGETTDVLICQELFKWLEDVFYSTYYAAMKSGLVQSCAADKNGIYRGLCTGIIEVNRREEEKLSAKDKSCFALVVRDKSALIETRVKQEFPRLTVARQTTLTVGQGAFQHGYAKGKQVNLNQVGGVKARAALGN